MAYNERNRNGAGANRTGAAGRGAELNPGAAGAAGTGGLAGYEFGTELTGEAQPGAARGTANRAGNAVPGARQRRPGRS